MNQEYLISRTSLGAVSGGEETMEADSLMSVLNNWIDGCNLLSEKPLEVEEVSKEGNRNFTSKI